MIQVVIEPKEIELNIAIGLSFIIKNVGDDDCVNLSFAFHPPEDIVVFRGLQKCEIGLLKLGEEHHHKVKIRATRIGEQSITITELSYISRQGHKNAGGFYIPLLVREIAATTDDLQSTQLGVNGNKDEVGQKKITQALFFAISHRFNIEELKTLCFSLGVDFDDIVGEGKAGKIRELVLYCQRHDKLEELVNQCSQWRPNYTWPEL